MLRTTPQEVRAIMPEMDITDEIILSYITGANSLVTHILSETSLPSITLLVEIEKWLAAHMIASTRERMARKEGAGGAFIEYAGEFTTGLKATSYGQMVLMLDSTGLMSSLGGKAASIRAVQS